MYITPQKYQSFVHRSLFCAYQNFLIPLLNLLCNGKMSSLFLLYGKNRCFLTRKNEFDILLTYLFENIFSPVKCRLDNFNLFRVSRIKTYPATKLKRERYQIYPLSNVCRKWRRKNSVLILTIERSTILHSSQSYWLHFQVNPDL